MPPQLARTESQAVADWLDEMALADQLGLAAAGWWNTTSCVATRIPPSRNPARRGGCAHAAFKARLGVIPAPYHHPVHIAEKVAMLDVVSNGRLEVGVGRGFSPKEYQVFGADMAHSRS